MRIYIYIYKGMKKKEGEEEGEETHLEFIEDASAWSGSIAVGNH